MAERTGDAVSYSIGWVIASTAGSWGRVAGSGRFRVADPTRGIGVPQAVGVCQRAGEPNEADARCAGQTEPGRARLMRRLGRTRQVPDPTDHPVMSRTGLGSCNSPGLVGDGRGPRRPSGALPPEATPAGTFMVHEACCCC